jgi:pimeloyl-ACP methyl ester carboxylesterase
MRIAPGLAMIIALSPFVMGCVATTPAFRDKAGRILTGSVARMEYVELGGSRQWICVRAESVDKPLLLILHGGPGDPEVLPFRRYDAGLEKDFIVVNWDQRGSGKSYSPSMSAESLSIEQILSDAHELVGYLKESFSKQKIYLLGHSWGSLLGALLASRYPEDFHAYIGMGQWVSMGDNERLCYEFTLREAERRGDRKAIAVLERIGAPVNGLYNGDWLESVIAQRKYLKKYGGFLYGKSGVLGLYCSSYLATTEYRGFSLSSYFKASRLCLRALWPQMAKVDLSRDAAKFGTPVFLFLGRNDWNTPPSLAEVWLTGISAPSKRILWFEDSAHCPSFEEPDKFLAALVRISHNEPLSEMGA